jgi:RHS repeat-associated protein
VDLGGGGAVYFVYDAGGRRVRKVHEHNDATVEERVYLDGYEIYRKRIQGNLVLERETLCIMDGARRVALVETKTVDDGNDNSPGQVFRYQLGTHLDSTSLELDEDGSIISCEEYYPYGSTSYQAGRSVAEVRRKRYRYTGKERDDETGLYYHGSRYYAPWLGRWTAADPSGVADALNLYLYVHGNPVIFTDPSGRMTTDVHLVIASLRRMNPTQSASLKAAYAAPKVEAPGGPGSSGTWTFAGASASGSATVGSTTTVVSWLSRFSGSVFEETGEAVKGITQTPDVAADLLYYGCLFLYKRGADIGHVLGLVSKETHDAATKKFSDASVTIVSSVVEGVKSTVDDAKRASEGDPEAAGRLAPKLVGFVIGLRSLFKRKGKGKAAVATGGTPNVLSKTVRHWLGKDVIVVDTPNGPQGFYRSTGTNSGMSNQWLPFDELIPKKGFYKDRFTGEGRYAGQHVPKELERYGTQELKDIGEALDQMDIPAGTEFKTIAEGNEFLDEHGVPRRPANFMRKPER